MTDPLPSKAKNARFGALVECLDKIVWHWSPEQQEEGFYSARQWWAALTGQSIAEQQASEDAWLEKVHPSDRDQAAKSWDTARATGNPYHSRFRVSGQDGLWHPIQVRGIAVRNELGDIVEWVGTLEEISDRKQIEQALRDSEQRYRALVTSSSDVVYRMTADWSSMYPLDGRNFVMGNVEPLSQWMTQNVPAFEHCRILAAIDQAVANKEVFELEHQVIRVDGTFGWTHSRAIPIIDQFGEIREWFGTASDITRRIQAEEALRDIQSRVEAALDAGAIGTWSWDIITDQFYCDASLARIFALSLEAVSGGSLEKIIPTIHPDDRTRVEEQVRQVVDNGDRYESEYRVAQPDGSWKWVTARGKVERDASGRAIRFPGVVIDITESKLAKEELARLTDQSERRKRLYETILSHTPDLAYVFNLDHTFAYANDVLLQMWGRTWDEAIGKTCLELGYEAWHASMHDREIEEVKATKKPLRGEVPFHGTFGPRIYDYILVPVIGANGEVEAVAGTTRDITERKRYEESLRDADRKKDDFIALLAHELRNPLAPIRNGLQVIRMAGNDVHKVTETRAMMERQLNHMVRLIDDLLDVSRITRNKMELRREHVTLADVIESAVEASEPAILEANHKLTVVLPSEPMLLEADITRLAQVFANLLTNSAKYTPNGGYICLEAQREGNQVLVSVRDTGIGIPATALPMIFDMFSQVDRSVERSTGGLGIGLALVKGLVEMHGGTVMAESKEGVGSTFVVKLPLALPNPIHHADVRQKESRPLARRRVMVVDDNQDGAESMALMLRLLENEVTIAHDGFEAVEMAANFQPEIILMDIGLPRLNGLDATRQIRKLPWGKGITIVALTGWGQENDRERSRDAGCDGHLVKPVNLTDLEKLLTSA